MRFHPSAQSRLESAEKGPEDSPDSDACKADDAYREGVRQAVLASMGKLKLDAFVYPRGAIRPG